MREGACVNSFSMKYRKQGDESRKLHDRFFIPEKMPEIPDLGNPALTFNFAGTIP